MKNKIRKEFHRSYQVIKMLLLTIKLEVIQYNKLKEHF